MDNQRGRTGPSERQMRAIQNRLNQRLRGVSLKVDGVYDRKTRAAVRIFQHENWLRPTGHIDRQTLEVLFQEPRDEIIARHDVHLVPQMSPNTCWAAAVAMMTGMSYWTVQRLAEKELSHQVMHNGKLDSVLNYSEFINREIRKEQTRIFAKVFGLKVISVGKSYNCEQLGRILKSGPLLLDSLHSRFGKDTLGSDSHLVVLAGARTGNQPYRYVGTTLLVYDPWPKGRGAIKTVDFLTWVHFVDSFGGAPNRFYRVWQRVP